jgi:hypothetical protein
MYWMTGMLGLLFAAAPFLLGYSNNQPALWTSLLVGAAVVLTSAFEALEADKDPIEHWLAGILGAVAIGAPFVLGFGNVATAMWTSVIIGGLMIVASAGRLLVTDEATYG